jgi:hypothetical protein
MWGRALRLAPHSFPKAFMIALVKKIGRYEFDILSPVAMTDMRDGTFEFLLPHGVKLMLSAEEKTEYDNAINFHKQVLYVYGAALGAGLRA